MVSKKEILMGDEIEIFLNNLEGINDILPLTMFVAEEVKEKLKNDLENFKNNHCEVKKDDRGTFIRVPPEHILKWRRLSRRVKNTNIGHHHLPLSLFVSLVSQYDAFIGKLYKYLLESKPETIKANEKSYNYTEIISHKSIEEFQTYVIHKEQEKLLRNSHLEQLKILQNKFDVDLTSDKELLSKFIEITERRNLFVHADGIVSKQYIDYSKKYNFTIDDDLKVGDKLHAPHIYFMECYCTLFEVGFKVSQILWRKILHDEADLANDNINTISFDLIEWKQYPLAAKLIDFALANPHIKKTLDEKNSLILTINKAQAFKWDGEEQECDDILEEIDWSAKAPEFKLAYYVLKNDWDNACKTMDVIGQDHEMITKHNYQNWPLFKEFRKQDLFKCKYKEIFGEKFEITMKSTE